MHNICSRTSVTKTAGAATLQAPRQRIACRQQKRNVAVNDGKDGKPRSVEDVLAAANALLDNLSAGTPVPQESIQASIDELSEMGYVCDESGCVLVLPGDKDRVAGPPVIRGILSGPNWSLGTLPIADSYDEEEGTPYTAVVSGPCWTVPLKPSELSDFVGMLNQLRNMVANLAAQGQWHGTTADRPASRVKWETNHIVMKASHASTEPGFSIEITFRTDRRSVVTSWPADVAAAVLAAVDAELGTGQTANSSSKTPATVSA